MMRACLIAAALALAPLLSQAQTPAASAPVAPASPAQKELAQKILKAQQASLEQLAVSLVEQPALLLLQQAAAALQNAPAEKRDAMSRPLEVGRSPGAEHARTDHRDVKAHASGPNGSSSAGGQIGGFAPWRSRKAWLTISACCSSP